MKVTLRQTAVLLLVTVTGIQALPLDDKDNSNPGSEKIGCVSLPCAVVMPFRPTMLVMRRVPVPILRILLVLATHHLLPAIMLLIPVVVSGFICLSVRNTGTR